MSNRWASELGLWVGMIAYCMVVAGCVVLATCAAAMLFSIAVWGEAFDAHVVWCMRVGAAATGVTILGCLLVWLTADAGSRP